MLDFVTLQSDSWRMKFRSKELDDVEPTMYWGSYITHPFIGLPNKTANQWA